MKRKMITILFFTLVSTLAFADYVGDYCNYSGVYSDPSIPKEEEFNMLLERIESPNFKEISKAISAIAVASKKELNDTECKISKYARQLLEYYQKNKQKIFENEDKIFLDDLINAIKKKIKTDSYASEA